VNSCNSVDSTWGVRPWPRPEEHKNWQQMKENRKIPLSTILASLAAGLAAAGLVLCGNRAQAQPSIADVLLPNAPNQQSGFAVGQVQFQGAAPNPNQLTFQVTSATGVTALTVKLTGTTLQGVVSSTFLTLTYGLTVSGPSTNESALVQLANDTLYAAVITATDAGGSVSLPAVTFDTINPDYYTFEAEDFDYQDGQYYDSLPPSFAELDSYYNLVAVSNIDCYHPSNGGNDAYRSNPLETENAGDTPRSQYLSAPATDFDVGFNAGGDWGNYTRHYPAGVYNIYLRGSDGNSSQADACEIGVLTSGLGTKEQAVKYIGEFAVPGLGWQIYSFCPAINFSGHILAWGAAGDQETLRFQVVNGNCNENFYLLVPAAPSVTPNNTNVSQGGTVTLGFYANAMSIPAIQWQTDNGTGGIAWSNVPSTIATYAVPTNLPAGPIEYQVVLTLDSDVNVTSAPVTLNIMTPTRPVVALDTYPSSAAAEVGTATTFYASFTGTVPISYQWLVSSNSGLTFTDIAGKTNTTLTVLNFSVFTNEYELEASNSIGVTYSTPATLTTTPAPPRPALQIAGDLVAELRSADLAVHATTWTNRSTSAASVGNFKSSPVVALAVSNNTINAGAPLWGAYTVNALYVGGSAGRALFSADLTPGEINTNGPVTMEAWVYATTIPGAQVQLSYGIGGGLSAPAEEREFGYGTNPYAGFTADQGGADTAWSTTPTAGWHYLAVTYDGTNLDLYQDGVTNGQTSQVAGGLDTVQTRLDVGQANGTNDTGGGNIFDGYIAAARVMSGVLTPAQVLNNYNAGLLAIVSTIPALAAFFGGDQTITLTWSSGVLVQATSLTGPWTPVPGAMSPAQVTPPPTNVPAMFYAVKN
jgi:hypothetical protein